MSLGTDILLKIRSTFESKSVEEAKKKTEELGKTTEKAGKESSDGMNVMAAATALMTGNVNGAIAAIAPLIEKTKALKLSLTQMTLVGALIGALVALFKSIRDRAAEAAETLERFKADSFERQVARIEAAHAKWDAANNKSLAIREASHQFFIAENDAYKQEALLINELAKQKELANAASEDERKIIENKFKGRADEISGAFDTRASEQEKKRLLQKAEDDKAKIAENEKLIAQKSSFAGKRWQDASSNINAANELSRGWGGTSFMPGGVTGSDKRLASADAAMADYKKMTQEINALRSENDLLKVSSEQNRKMAAIQEVKTRTLGVSGEASGLASGREASDIQAAIVKAAKQQDLQDKIDSNEQQQRSAEERFKPLTDSASRKKESLNREASEYGKVVESYRKKGDNKGVASSSREYERIRAAADASSKALDELTNQATATLKAYKDQSDALKEQMKRIGQ